MFAGADGSPNVPQIVARLAATLAHEVAEEILVVDCNFDRPGPAEPSAPQTRRGLVDVPTGGADWREAVCRTDTENLHVLPGSRFPTDDGGPAEDAALAALLNELRRRFRLVLIAAGSLAHRGALHLARHCDATYLVVQLHRTPRRAARQAVHDVERSGGLVAGCIVTDA